MVIDTSALIALLQAEPETPRFVEAIAAANRRLVAAPSYLETAIIMVSRSGPEAKEKVDRLMVELGIEIVPFAQDQAILAVSAYEQFGKGIGHAAGLNFWRLLQLCAGEAHRRAYSIQRKRFLTHRSRSRCACVNPFGDFLHPLLALT